MILVQALMDTPVKLDQPLAIIGSSERKSPEALRGKGNLVLFFLNEQCSVTYYYRARLQRLVKDFSSKGFRFAGIRTGRRQYPNAPIELPEVKGLEMPFLDDTDGALMRQFGVGQSMTFALVDKLGKLRYFGGLDDNVVELKVKKTPLRDAMRLLAAGKPIATKRANALGCAILPLELP